MLCNIRIREIKIKIWLNLSLIINDFDFNNPIKRGYKNNKHEINGAEANIKTATKKKLNSKLLDLKEIIFLILVFLLINKTH